MAITMSRLTNAKMESFLNGEYIKVKASMRVRQSPISVLLEVPLVEVVMVVSVLRAKMPMKRTAMA